MLARSCFPQVLLIFCLFLSGCGGESALNQPGGGGGESALSETAPAPERPGLSGNYDNLAVLSFLASTREGLVDVSPGAVTDRERSSILARATPPEEIQSLESGSALLQMTTHQAEGSPLLVYTLDPLQGESSPYLAYRPETLQVRSPHNGITYRVPALEIGSHVLRYAWTVPPSSTATLVAVQPENLSQFSQADIFAIPESNRVETVLELNVTAEGDRFFVRGEARVNDQLLLSLDAPAGSVIRNGSGQVTNRAVLPLFPTFKHPVSGLFSLAITLDGETEVEESYLQRGLTWESDWPVIETADFSPIQFTNRLVWDVGDPTVEESSARWRATFPGDTFPRWTTQPLQPFQTGAQAAFAWNPDSLELSARGDRPTSFRLVPEGLEPEYADSEAFRQARETTVTYPYSVEGQAVSYPSPPPLYTKARGGGMVPARIRQLFVENARFDPELAQGSESTTFRADVLSFHFDEPQIRWRLEIGAAGKTLAQEEWLEFDESYELAIPWDRTDEFGDAVPPGFYTGDLTVEVREKTRVDRQGNPILLQGLASAEYVIPDGSADVTITSFTATPNLLQASTPATVRFEAAAVTSGFDGEPQLRWTLLVQTPAGTPLYSTERTGTLAQLLVDWPAPSLPAGIYTARLRVEARDGALVVDDETDLRLVVSAAPPPPDVDFEVEFEQLFVNEPFAPELGDILHIRALARILGVIPSGYDVAFTWSINILQGGSTVYSRDVATGSSPLLLLDVEEIEEPGEYRLLAKVRATLTPLQGSEPPPPPGDPIFVEKQADLPFLAGLPVLEIRDSQGTMIGLGLNPRANQDAVSLQRELEKSVFPFGQGVPGLSEVWTLEAKRLSFTGAEPERIEVKLVGDKSGVVTGEPGPFPGGAPPQPAVMLERTGPGHYEGSFQVTDGLIRVGRLHVPKAGGAPGQTEPVITTYAIGFQRKLAAGTGLEAAQNFVQALFTGTVPEVDPYRVPRQSLGQFQELLSQERAPFDVAFDTPSNLPTCGFEAVQASLAPSGLQGGSLNAVVKVRHPAWVVHYNHHGVHSSGSLEAFGALFTPAPLNNQRRMKLAEPPPGVSAQLIISACSVLDLNDYNNYYTLPPIPDDPAPLEHGLLDEVDARRPTRIGNVPFSPGQLWQLSTSAGNGRVVLLGYAAPAPTQGTEHVFSRYRDALSEGRSVPVAWVLANLRVARDSGVTTQYRNMFMNACAWDADNYYYIPYGLPTSRETADPATAEGVWRIPRAQWNAVRSRAWKVPIPQDVGVMEAGPND